MSLKIPNNISKISLKQFEQFQHPNEIPKQEIFAEKSLNNNAKSNIYAFSGENRKSNMSNMISTASTDQPSNNSISTLITLFSTGQVASNNIVPAGSSPSHNSLDSYLFISQGHDTNANKTSPYKIEEIRFKLNN